MGRCQRRLRTAARALVLDRLNNRKPNSPRGTAATTLGSDNAAPRLTNHFGIVVFDFQFTATVNAAHGFGPALDQDRRLDGNGPVRSATRLQPSNALAGLRLRRRFTFGFTPGRARSGFRLAHGASLPHLNQLAAATRLRYQLLMKFITGSLIAVMATASAVAHARVIQSRAASPLFVTVNDDNMPSNVKLAKGFSKVAGLSWSDAAGDHYALFTSKTTDVKSMHSIYLQVDVYDGAAGKPLKLTRSVKDLSEKCEYDNTTKFVDASVMLSDFDGDSIQELVFAYTTGCRSDVSPDTMKLLVLEGKDKHILRGQTRERVSDTEFVGGGFKPEGFKKASKLLDGAKAHWATLIGSK